MNASAIARWVAALGFLLGFPVGVAAAWDPVRAHPQNPHILEFRGQPTVLRTYAESYSSVIDSGLPFVPYLDVLQRDGMNLTRVWCLGFPPDSAPPERFMQPWPRSTAQGNALDGLGKWDFSQWNETYFDRLKAFVLAASERDIVVELTLFSTFYHNVEWQAGPFHPSNNVQGIGPNNWNDTLRDVPANQQLLVVQQAAVRRIVSELNGFDNVYFEVQNEPFWNPFEVGQTEVGDAEEVAFHTIMLNAIRDEEAGLPNRHMVAHNFPQRLSTMSSDFDVINGHYPAAVPTTTIAGAEALLNDHYSLGKILALDETDTDNATQTRLEAWMFLIGGGGIYDGLDAHDAVYSPTDPSGDNALGNAMRGAVRNIGTFMDQLHRVALRRDLSWITGGVPQGAKLQASASPDQQYVAYLHHGQSGNQPFQLHYDPISTSNHSASLQVTLAAGDWRAVWTRPSDLAELQVQEFTHAGGSVTLATVNYQEDVALRIDRTGSGDTTPPPPPSGLSAVANSDGTIFLSWGPVAAFDLAGYRVYRSVGPGVPVDASHRVAEVLPGETSFSDFPPTPQVTYYYVVTAVDLEGNELGSTEEESATMVLPIPDLLLSVNPVGQYVLEWTTALSGWKLQESPDLSPGSWTDSDLVPEIDGNHYQVIVTPSPQLRFFRLAYVAPAVAPSQPVLRIFPIGEGQMALEWTASPAGWRLQESPDLSAGSWIDSEAVPVLVADQYQVTFTPTADRRFFRLAFGGAPAMPELSVSSNDLNQVVIEWPVEWSGWRLQESPDLTPGSWVDSTLTPVVEGDHFQISVNPTESRRFFRLASP